PEQRSRDARLGELYDGESDVSYDWLWHGTPLDTADDESFTYRHHH
ncbi:MAG TPA: FAD-binding dehydrogenase, partial [Streptomyces sp.]|nr:FAD-binding dehydrogenase [Streptomyces sp.]